VLHLKAQLEQHHDTIFQRKYSPALPERGTSPGAALPRRGLPGSAVPTAGGKDAAVGPARAGAVGPPVQRFNATSCLLTRREMRPGLTRHQVLQQKWGSWQPHGWRPNRGHNGWGKPFSLCLPAASSGAAGLLLHRVLWTPLFLSAWSATSYFGK